MYAEIGDANVRREKECLQRHGPRLYEAHRKWSNGGGAERANWLALPEYDFVLLSIAVKPAGADGDDLLETRHGQAR